MTLGQAVIVRGALAQAIEEIIKTGTWDGRIHIDIARAYLMAADCVAGHGVPRQRWIEEKILPGPDQIAEESAARAKRRIEAHERGGSDAGT
jgi:hypothetical protein